MKVKIDGITFNFRSDSLVFLIGTHGFRLSFVVGLLGFAGLFVFAVCVMFIAVLGWLLCVVFCVGQK